MLKHSEKFPEDLNTSCLPLIKLPLLPVEKEIVTQAGMGTPELDRDAIKVIRETKEEKGKEADRSKHR